jgi:hypothetical protein
VSHGGVLRKSLEAKSGGREEARSVKYEVVRVYV